MDEMRIEETIKKMEAGTLADPTYRAPIVNASCDGNKLTVTFLMDGPVSDIKTVDPTRGDLQLTFKVGGVDTMIGVKAIPMTPEAVMFALQQLMKKPR